MKRRQFIQFGLTSTSLCTLTACGVSPLMMISPQASLMLRLLKPLVGQDLSATELLQHPAVSQRLKPLVGDAGIDLAVKALTTADTVQREGALFYVLSRTDAVPDQVKRAALVYNAQKDQMALWLVQKGSKAIIRSETVAKHMPTNTVWPQAVEMAMNIAMKAASPDDPRKS